jgi:glucose/arabinose dehydrogenase
MDARSSWENPPRQEKQETGRRVVGGYPVLAAASAAVVLAATGGPAAQAAAPYVPTQNANESRPPNGTGHVPAFPGQTRAPVDAKGVQFEVKSWAKPLVRPWGLVFLPDGRGLVTERAGRIRYIDKDGTLSPPVAGVPEIFTTGFRSGLYDLKLDPKFPKNHRIYFSYLELLPEGVTLALMRAELNGLALSNQKVIFRALPTWPNNSVAGNTGGRMLFDKAGMIVMTVGDRYPKDYTLNHAQLLNSDLGKLIRIDTDGKAPRDNPFYGRPDVRPEIYAYGIRSPESLAVNPRTGAIWEAEHGPRGGDEINIMKPRANYGWPVITYGIEYNGTPILGDITQKEGMEQPIYYWDPVIAPSGLMFYTGNAFPAWKGSLFIGGMFATSLVRLTLDGDKVVGEERFLKDLGQRIRNVVQGPDGMVYVLTDEVEGQIYRLTPK